ncbi:hypothetical protein BRADI_1g56264v3 [Brachypodium distachyon]|uniref:Uncharacterized protein n=1 Tax=Brachypodium distachyon TaxID=15368 RepID=A0A0Q3NTE3_BRADI|nr:hypothetical protein BRADI_1g56264v3 [Brachypodium distachyon]
MESGGCAVAWSSPCRRLVQSGGCAVARSHRMEVGAGRRFAGSWRPPPSGQHRRCQLRVGRRLPRERPPPAAREPWPSSRQGRRCRHGGRPSSWVGIGERGDLFRMDGYVAL